MLPSLLYTYWWPEWAPRLSHVTDDLCAAACAARPSALQISQPGSLSTEPSEYHEMVVPGVTVRPVGGGSLLPGGELDPVRRTPEQYRVPLMVT